MRWPLLCLCRPFMIFEGCPDSNPECFNNFVSIEWVSLHNFVSFPCRGKLIYISKHKFMHSELPSLHTCAEKCLYPLPPFYSISLKMMSSRASPFNEDLSDTPLSARYISVDSAFNIGFHLGYNDFHNLMGFTSKKMPNNILKKIY